MTSISGFTFVHNAIAGGYPIVEAIRAVCPYVDEIVVVDMQSTDGTRELLEKLKDKQSFSDIVKKSQGGIRIINGYWGNKAGETLREAHDQYIQCNGDVIIHFEADEVYDDNLIRTIINFIGTGIKDMSVYRIQLEQNFQRCRWYPEAVHRVFPNHSNTRKEGHTTNRHNLATVINSEYGLLWDITNCFRDNWLNRVNKQAELRNETPQYLMAGLHYLRNAVVKNEENARFRMTDNHWTWRRTPFDIPKILKLLVGKTKYIPRL